jgi:hypothetical protein
MSYFNEGCRLCMPPEENYHTVQLGGRGPGQIGVSYQSAPLESVTSKELSDYLKTGELPKNVCKEHMKDHLSDCIEDAYGALTKFSINLTKKNVVLKRKGREKEIVSFSKLANILEG